MVAGSVLGRQVSGDDVSGCGIRAVRDYRFVVVVGSGRAGAYGGSVDGE